MVRYPSAEENKYHNDFFIKAQKRRIDKINEVLGEVVLTKLEEDYMIWLSGQDDETVDTIMSIMLKVGSIN